MKKIIKILLSALLLISLYSCSNKVADKVVVSNSDPSVLYISAMNELRGENYEIATKKFSEIISQFPLTNEGIQSQIMLAFIDYAKLDYDEAIFKFNKIIKLYPAHKNIDYVYYMRAMCYFEQIENEALDGNNNTEALNNFSELINRFPNSEYAKDSKQKIIFVNENIAAKNMNIAKFYLDQKKLLAALNRYNIVINNYSKSKFTPEALYRTVEIYLYLGMREDAKKVAAVIAHNYPKSKWYDYAYNLINKDNIKKNKPSLLKKISNIFNRNEADK